jgi:two-component system, chemotaxis family, response regulator Rcp1
LILLDLNIPRKDGREVLAEVKADPNLQTIPVVLTTSQSEDDILASYRLHANCYIVKPVNLDQFMHAIEAVEDFWLNVVRLPIRVDMTPPTGPPGTDGPATELRN